MMEESNDGGGGDRKAVAASNDEVAAGAPCERMSWLLVRNLPQQSKKCWGIVALEDNVEQQSIPWDAVVGNLLYENSCDASSGWARD